MSNAGKKIRMPTLSDAIAIHKRLTDVVTSENGKAIYATGHSDETVAAEFGFSTHTIAKLRQSEFGPLPIGRPAGRKTKVKRGTKMYNAVRALKEKGDE